MTNSNASLILPVNRPLPNYVQLCGEAVENLPPVHMEPFIVIDSHVSKNDLARAAFRLGFAAAQFRKQYSKLMGASILKAALLSSTLGKTITPSGANHGADLMVASSKITTYWAPRLVVLPDSLAGELHPLQKAWITDGAYVLFGFSDHNEPFDDDLHNAIGTALVMLDRHIIEANSFDPAAHSELAVSSQAATDFQSLVGDMFGKKRAAWHWSLPLLQVGLSVCFRAMYMGRSPVREFNKFCQAGGKHYLEYPGLCP